MEKIKVEKEYPKEYYELLDGLKEVVKNSKQALKDGFQAGQDIPVIVTGSLAKLMTGLSGMEKLGDEWSEDMFGCVETSVDFGVAVAKEVFAKDE